MQLESYADVGGLEPQIQEIKEAVELPLTHPELYEDIGIKPPKGVILYGEPGTGKTLLAKAVANSTSATFLRVVGSELIQKYLGDGPKLVRELFRVADELAPSIVFIDEIDAVGTKRYESTSGGEREIQRTMLELLNQVRFVFFYSCPLCRVFFSHSSLGARLAPFPPMVFFRARAQPPPLVSRAPRHHTQSSHERHTSTNGQPPKK